MKSILISIKPKWVAKILNGEKTIEIRKTAPKCELPIDVYIYCTKNDNGLRYWGYHMGGRIFAKFTLKKIERIYIIDKLHCRCEEHEWQAETPSLSPEKLCESSCLDEEEIWDYLTNGNGYAWHISDLQIFDKPKELSDFFYGFKLKNNGVVMFDYVKKALVQRTLWGYEYSYLLKKAPQSWRYVEELKK